MPPRFLRLAPRTWAGGREGGMEGRQGRRCELVREYRGIEVCKHEAIAGELRHACTRVESGPAFLPSPLTPSLTCTLHAGIFESATSPPATPMSLAATSDPTTSERLGAMLDILDSTNLST
jgi:hypothetical protein